MTDAFRGNFALISRSVASGCQFLVAGFRKVQPGDGVSQPDMRSFEFRVSSVRSCSWNLVWVWFWFRVPAVGEEIDFQGLTGLGQGLEGVWQEAVLLEIPLGGRHQTIEQFRVQGHSHFMHEADDAGEFPAGLEEQFEILAGPGAPDDAEDHLHDEMEF